MKLSYLIVGLVLIAFIVGCAEEAVTPPPAETPPAETPPAPTEEVTPPAPTEEVTPPTTAADIVLKGRAGFEPSEITIAAGSSVTVLVQDDASHRITIMGTTERSPVLTSGQTHEFVFNEPGTYKLYDTSYSKFATVNVE